MNRLCEFRMIAGLSIAELAEKMGVHPNTVYSWETEKSHPQHYQIQRLAMLFECDTDILELIPSGSKKPKKRPAAPSAEYSESPLYRQFMALSLDEQRYILAYTTPEPYRAAVKRIREGRLTTDEAATIMQMMRERGRG